VIVDDNLEFKNILAGGNSNGMNKVMKLLPYARDVEYKDGLLSMVLEFVNEHAETELGIQMEVTDDLKMIFDKIEYGEV
jgi:hypothetical protein